MSEEIKIYHVETQEDYDDLMIKLENQGYRWQSGDKPTIKPQYWDKQRENTAIVLDGFDEHHITRGSISWCKGFYSNAPIIKHKAKGVNRMEKVVVPQFVAGWFENVSEKELDGNDIFRIIQDVLRVGNGQSTWNDYDVDEKLVSWVEENEETFLNLIVNCTKGNGYEAEEKKYYWRKKKEYMFEFEDDDYIYLNIEKNTGEIYFSSKKNFHNFQTVLTEKEAKQAVGVNDFNKLERVEIDDVQ